MSAILLTIGVYLWLIGVVGAVVYGLLWKYYDNEWSGPTA